MFLGMKLRKGDRSVVGVPRHPLNGRPSGIFESQHLCPFVKGLSSRVVSGASQQVTQSILVSPIEVRMATGYYKDDARQREVRV